ncbi:MAG TPA: hypothetical protein VKW08_00440 [Xanthobacteraceae bacterium]|jgi:hypothetical protein|nr:hypothetical protein [Xanthobacteraceae bacterium]
MSYPIPSVDPDNIQHDDGFDFKSGRIKARVLPVKSRSEDEWIEIASGGIIGAPEYNGQMFGTKSGQMPF